MPRPLSSQTNSTGTRRPVWSHQPAVLNAAVALAWLIDASPNEQTAIASAGHGVPPPSSRRDRSIANAAPTARGRWEAIVDVVGYDLEVDVAEHLVPPAGDRLDRRRDHAAQDVAGGVGDRVGVARGHGRLGGAGAVERAGAVVQERRVGLPQRRRDGRVALVPGRPDRVVALAEAAQPPAGEVEVPAGELGVEQRPRGLAGQAGAVPDRFLRRPLVGRRREGRDRDPEPFVEILRGGHVDSITDLGRRLPPSKGVTRRFPRARR